MARSHRSYSVPFQGFPAGDPQCAVSSPARPPARLPRLLSRPEGHIAGKPHCHFHLHQQNFMPSVPWMQMEKPNQGTFISYSCLLSHLPGCLFYSHLNQALSGSQTSLHQLSLCLCTGWASACNTLSALLALGNSAQMCCHPTVTSALNIVTLSSRHLRLPAMPEVSISLSVPQARVFRSVSLLPPPPAAAPSPSHVTRL